MKTLFNRNTQPAINDSSPLLTPASWGTKVWTITGDRNNLRRTIDTFTATEQQAQERFTFLISSLSGKGYNSFALILA